MATESLLAALAGNYGMAEILEDDVNTVRGLLNFCKKWTEGRVYTDELETPCLAMASRLRGGADEMEADVNKTPDMASDMKTPLTRTIEAYRAIADVLDELPEFAQDENIRDFLDDLEVFEEERQAVLDAQEQIQFQLSGKALLCPRCGSSEEGPICEACDLQRLYPDPKANRGRYEQAQLSGLYARVYRAFTRVMAGEKTLDYLWPRLEPLEEHLESLIDTRKRLAKRAANTRVATSRRFDARAAERMLLDSEKNVESALDGAARMRGARETLRMTDLSRGWEDIFFAAQVIEMTAARIRHRLGGGDEEEVAPESPQPTSTYVPPPSTGDQVSFSRE